VAIFFPPVGICSNFFQPPEGLSSGARKNPNWEKPLFDHIRPPAPKMSKFSFQHWNLKLQPLKRRPNEIHFRTPGDPQTHHSVVSILNLSYRLSIVAIDGQISDPKSHTINYHRVSVRGAAAACQFNLYRIRLNQAQNPPKFLPRRAFLAGRGHSCGACRPSLKR
jgi:hypothetical protein